MRLLKTFLVIAAIIAPAANTAYLKQISNEMLMGAINLAPVLWNQLLANKRRIGFVLAFILSGEMFWPMAKDYLQSN